MNIVWRLLILFLVSGLAACTAWRSGEKPPSSPTAVGQPLATPLGGEEIQLPPPQLEGKMSLEEALAKRRSVRQFRPDPLSIDQISQLCWALQGITHPSGFRTAPSAGALYPLEVYVVLPEGVYHYRPQGHTLTRWQEGDLRAALHAVALRQDAVLQAAAVFVITAVYERTEAKYGKQRSPRYVHMEAGHAAQNLLLQAVALGLGSVPIGAFYDDGVQEALKLPADHRPLYLLPVGHPAP
ncbi:MAG: SagB/ThcOx family dehydrogenase [Anaerolineales bacterium]|nr:SagB/ThcOx family dehydrogenase [Anaerolineales bacterium]MCS7249036.1 SagB/ThcOx family dehydrogenase [Anaerolineales bacterium]MDW8162849.1 SagB/ThcOx family dehydrogenase [Anaerolineales bacterium]MDW8446637.1 SagB/ThcOx family dehydrogenase [Anaerolineales bacterium]